MKVLVVNWRDIHNPEAGGAEIYLDEILKRKPDGWEIDYVAASFKQAPPVEKTENYTIYRIFNNLFFNFTFRHYWKTHLSAKKYDLVIDSVSKIPLATPLYIRNIPIVAIHYHVHGKSLFKELPFPVAFYVYYMEKILLQFYKNTPTVLISESNYSELARDYGYKNIVIAYPGIEFGLIKRYSPNNRSIHPTLFCFGRLKKYKRFDHILKAFSIVLKNYPGSRLIIAGKGDDEPRLKEICRSLKMENSVDFPGFITEEKKAELIKSSWASAITSEKEGWGIVVIEANSGGLPVIGYDVEGIRNSIDDGHTGFLVPNGDIGALADKIGILFGDSRLRNDMSGNAEEWSRRFTWDNTAKIFYKLVENTLKQNKERLVTN